MCEIVNRNNKQSLLEDITKGRGLCQPCKCVLKMVNDPLKKNSNSTWKQDMNTPSNGKISYPKGNLEMFDLK